jgi:hypothetical protein
MKKLNYLVSLFLVCSFVFISCQKDKAEIKDESIKSDATKTTKQLLAFKQNLQSKSGETMAADSAEWYLEGLLNFEQANNSHIFGDVDFYHDTLTVTVTDGQISLDELNILYTTIDAWAETIQQQSGNEDYTYDIVDLNLETTGHKSGMQNLVVTLSGGVLGIGLNYYPFGPTDYWYWGYDLGKCGDYLGQYVGRDAASELQRKFMNPIAVPGAGYYIDVETISVIGGFDSEFEDPDNPYGDYMLFAQSGIGPEPVIDYCISPDEMNYYLSKFDFIRDTKKPLTKQYKTVYVYDTFVPAIGEWYHVHVYDLLYGIKIENPD